MNYVEFQAGNQEYKLCLDIKNVVALEKRLGCNPMGIFGKGDTIPQITQMIDILWASAQKYNSNVTTEKATEIFEAYINDGHTMTDFVVTILNIYRASGIISTEGEPKNA